MHRLLSILSILLLASVSHADTVKVGVLVPLTGARSDSGEDQRNSLMLAANEINEDQANKFKIRLIFEDSRYEALAAVTGAKKLIKIDRVDFIIGPHSTTEVLAVTPIVEKEQVVLITPGAQGKEISGAGDFVFRLTQNAVQEAPWFTKFIAKKIKTKKLHFLCLPVLYESYVKEYLPHLKDAGVEIGIIEEYATKESDFRPYLLKLKAKNAAALFLGAPPSEMKLILLQLKQLGMGNIQLFSIGVEGPEILQAGEVAQGLLYPYPFDVSGEEGPVDRFSRGFKRVSGHDPDIVAANSYDALFLLNLCYNKVGLSPEKVRDCLYQIKDYSGASGRFSIDQNGDAERESFVKTVRDGKFVRYQD